jgi:hypothetical protein
LPAWVLISTHTPLQFVNGAVQTQAPATQNWSPAHAVAHAPQFFGLVWRSTQLELQLVRPPLQMTSHLPAEHAWPAGQTVPQAPQFVGSLLWSTHLEPHFRLVPPHWSAHWPSEHT